MSLALIITLAVLAIVLIFAESDLLVTIVLLFLGIYFLLWLIKGISAFFKEFAKNEWAEVEKSSGTPPPGEELVDVIEDSGEVLLNENKTEKTNTTGKIAEGAEEFVEKLRKFFRI